jgi:hypothetical protein
VFPRKFIPQRRSRVNYDLYAANGNTIHTYGWLPLSLNLGLRREFTWRFVVADVTEPLIGADFLTHFGLLVDCRNNRLLDNVTSLSTPAQAASPRIASIEVTNTGTPVDALLSDEFSDLIRPSGVRRDVQHNTIHIRTTPGPPVTCRPRRLAPDRLKVAKAQFDAMVRDGTARPSESPWSSALHLVPKKDNGWRPCGDYRALNSRTVPDCYPVRHIHDYSHQISGCRVFTKIDLVRAYNQIMSIPVMSKRPQSPLLLAYSSSPSCLLVCATLHEQSATWTLILLRLLRRHPRLLPIPRGARAPSTGSLRPTAHLRDYHQPDKVRLPRTRGHLPRL